MKSLKQLLAAARRAPITHDQEEPTAGLAGRVLASLREPEIEVTGPSDWLVLGRWAAGLACALALLAFFTAPQPGSRTDAPPASNPLAAMGGW